MTVAIFLVADGRDRTKILLRILVGSARNLISFSITESDLLGSSDMNSVWYVRVFSVTPTETCDWINR